MGRMMVNQAPTKKTIARELMKKDMKPGMAIPSRVFRILARSKGAKRFLLGVKKEK